MDVYGPALPPGYVKTDSNESDESENNSTTYENQSEQPRKIIGPQCPDFLSEKLRAETNENDFDDFTDSKTTDYIGPMLPASFQRLPCDNEDADDTYGPLPIQSFSKSDLYDQKAAIEKRAENMKNKLDNKNVSSTETLQREEWMVVPDTSRKNQLGAISQCLAPQKQSSKEKHHHHRHSQKDKETTEKLKKYNKSKRSESLLDMHKKGLEKKSKEKSKKKERKAFDRDEIGVKQFSKQQVNTIVGKAKYLNSRFGAGSQQYL